jgi:predicted RNA binding protein YcfA (HicA-like mRNA interferase family)
MARLPRLKAKVVLGAIRKLGFEVQRVKGSHHFMKHPDGRCTVIPVHAGETIGPGLLMKIMSDIDLTREEFEKLLEG